MKNSFLLGLVLVTASTPAVFAQKAVKPPAPAAAPKKAAPAEEEADASDEEGSAGHRFLFGLAGGALTYDGGRDEQALGAVFRWVPTPWFSLSTTPTSVRAREIATSTLPATSRSGLTDIPVEATIAHGFGGVTWSPSLAASLGVTLPVGDTASGLGSGEVGYSVSGGLGFTPAERLWVHLGAGRSLTRFSVQSAFSSGAGWGDASAGMTLTERLGASVGFSGDLGSLDSGVTRATSLGGGLSVGIGRAGTVNFTGSKGLTGAAPRWSFSLGVGTAFPYLNHLGGSSPNNTLQDSFGGGTHGLPNGKGNGGGSATAGTNRGRGKKP